MIALIVFGFAQTILVCINFSDPLLVIFFQWERFSVWVKKGNAINDVINTVSIKDRFQLSNVIIRCFFGDVADLILPLLP